MEKKRGKIPLNNLRRRGRGREQKGERDRERKNSAARAYKYLDVDAPSYMHLLGTYLRYTGRSLIRNHNETDLLGGRKVADGTRKRGVSYENAQDGGSPLSRRWRSWLTLTGRQAAILRKICRTSPSPSKIGTETRSFTRHSRHRSR